MNEDVTPAQRQAGRPLLRGPRRHRPDHLQPAAGAQRAHLRACTSAWPRSAGAINDDPSIKVLILTGAGDKAFAAGTDITQFRAFKTPRGRDRLRGPHRPRARRRSSSCRVPTIAAITGACTGGGAGIAACCDLRIGTADREIRLPDRAHARQLPVDVEHQPAHRADRPGAGQGHHLHGAPGRGARRRWRSAC